MYEYTLKNALKPKSKTRIQKVKKLRPKGKFCENFLVKKYVFVLCDHYIEDPAHRSWFESPGRAKRSPALHQNAFGFLAQVVYVFIPV